MTKSLCSTLNTTHLSQLDLGLGLRQFQDSDIKIYTGLPVIRENIPVHNIFAVVSNNFHLFLTISLHDSLCRLYSNFSTHSLLHCNSSSSAFGNSSIVSTYQWPGGISHCHCAACLLHSQNTSTGSVCLNPNFAGVSAISRNWQKMVCEETLLQLRECHTVKTVQVTSLSRWRAKMMRDLLKLFLYVFATASVQACSQQWQIFTQVLVSLFVTTTG